MRDPSIGPEAGNTVVFNFHANSGIYSLDPGTLVVVNTVVGVTGVTFFNASGSLRNSTVNGAQLPNPQNCATFSGNGFGVLVTSSDSAPHHVGITMARERPAISSNYMRGTSRIHDHFAEHLAPCQILVSGTDFAEGKRAVDHRLEASREDVAEDLVQLAHGSHVRSQNP